MKIEIIYEHNFADARDIREEVFVQEQGFTNEFDEIDEFCTHVTLYADDVLAGCARVYAKEKSETLHIGRIALRKSFRNLGLGRILVESCERYGRKQGYCKFILDAQCRMQGFYETLGYRVEGKVHMDEHVWHVQMCKYVDNDEKEDEQKLAC